MPLPSVIKFGTLTGVGRSVFQQGHARSLPREGPNTLNFWDLLYICPIGMTHSHSNQILHGDQERKIFTGSTTPPALPKNLETQMLTDTWSICGS